MVLEIRLRSSFVVVKFYVDGVLADRDNLNVDASLQTITVSGKELEHTPEVYYLMNKPAGVVSARKDKEHQTVIDLIKPKIREMVSYPVADWIETRRVWC